MNVHLYAWTQCIKTEMIKEYLGWQLQQWISSYATDTQWLFEYEILFIKEKHIELF